MHSILRCVQRPNSTATQKRVTVGVTSGFDVDAAGELIGHFFSEQLRQRFGEERNGQCNIATEAFYDKLCYNFHPSTTFIAAVGPVLTSSGCLTIKSHREPILTSSVGARSAVSDSELRNLMADISSVIWTFNGLVRASCNVKADKAVVSFDDLPGAIEFVAHGRPALTEYTRGNDVKANYGFGQSNSCPADIVAALIGLAHSASHFGISIWCAEYV
jgi:hypothetical protein